MTQRTKDILWAAAIIFALWAGYDILINAGRNLPDRELQKFTEQDHWCAEMVRQNAQFASMYTDRELLRICYTRRVVAEDNQ